MELDAINPPLSRRQRIDLGIAICHATTKPGQRRSLAEIAARAECSPEAISKIERRTIQKIKDVLIHDSEITAFFGVHWNSPKPQSTLTETK